MKNNRAKKEGFTLLEVIISMALIAIISVGIYNGYMIIIKQTKEAQVKQLAALKGKKVLEEIQAAVEDNSFDVSDGNPEIGNIELVGGPDVYEGTGFLDKNFDDAEEASAKYIETITLTPTKVEGTDEGIALNNSDNPNSESNKIYISKSKVDSKDYIAYYLYDSYNAYNQEDSSKIPLPSRSQDGKKKIEMSVYLDTASNLTQQNVEIKDYKGKELLSVLKYIDENLVVNFSKYKETNGSLPPDVEIELNMYNRTSTIPNIYIEKQKDLTVNVKPRKGKINIHNNQPEDIKQESIGTLYDIKVEIKKDDETLFTGYSKKNIH